MMRTYRRPEPIPDVLAEYLEEAAFLYGARKRCNSDPELSWRDIESYDRRLEANLHGLTLGGLNSARLLKSKLVLEKSGDPGESFVAAAVYPRLGLVEPMQWLVEAIASAPPHSDALVDGLIFGDNESMQPWLKRLLAHENPPARRAASQVIGRRWRAESEVGIAALLDDEDPGVCVAAASALQRNGVRVPTNRLVRLLDDQRAVVSLAAARLLLEEGHRPVLDRLRDRLETPTSEFDRSIPLLLAATGDLDDAQIIGKALQRGSKDERFESSCLISLGLVGDAQTIELLISYLVPHRSESAFVAAIAALRTLTGVDTLPGFDLDEAPPEIVLAYRESWLRWWAEHRSAMSGRQKWRRGKPTCPMVLVDDIDRPGNPHRALSHLELCVRYGCRVSFDPEESVGGQERQIGLLREFAEKTIRTFRPGILYFGSQAA